MGKEHILLLGATGVSGVEFIKLVSSLPESEIPFLTLLIRPCSNSKLPATVHDEAHFRIVEGELKETSTIKKALSSSSDSPAFPKVTTVVSFLGAYATLKNFFTRDSSTPIADALRKVVLPTMQEVNVTRILALSTPASFHTPREGKTMPWKWWFSSWFPIIFTPQGSAEMTAIGRAVADAGKQNQKLEWTVFRVPMLTNGRPEARIIAGELNGAYAGSTELSRGSMVRWVLTEVRERKWVKELPMLGNA
jgi:hypothetical protein